MGKFGETLTQGVGVALLRRLGCLIPQLQVMAISSRRFFVPTNTKNMKTLTSATLIFLTLLQSGCATLYGGRISDCQRHRPPQGQPSRKIRGAAATCDIVFGIFLFEVPIGIDFLTGAIYKPCENVTVNPPVMNNQLSNPIIMVSDTPKKVSKNDEIIGTQQTVQMIDSKPKGTVSYLDYKYGFRDAKFEMPIDEFTEMVPTSDSSHSSNKREQFYHRTSDIKSIGEYQINDILYIFYHGKLMTIMIETKGYSNSRGILAMLQDMYGNGFKDNEYIEEYLWEGAKATVLYDENSITHDARIWFDCTKLSNQNKAEEKLNQQKAESGF